jgi:hypothetical protein
MLSIGHLSLVSWLWTFKRVNQHSAIIVHILFCRSAYIYLLSCLQTLGLSSEQSSQSVHSQFWEVGNMHWAKNAGVHCHDYCLCMNTNSWRCRYFPPNVESVVIDATIEMFYLIRLLWSLILTFAPWRLASLVQQSTFVFDSSMLSCFLCNFRASFSGIRQTTAVLHLFSLHIFSSLLFVSFAVITTNQ